MIGVKYIGSTSTCFICFSIVMSPPWGFHPKKKCLHYGDAIGPASTNLVPHLKFEPFIRVPTTRCVL